jgi:hypothetical protein
MPRKTKLSNEDREVQKAERYIRKNIKPLQDEGVINLDAPAREVVDEITRRLQNPPKRSAKSAVQTGGYILVGDKGWCDHRKS